MGESVVADFVAEALHEGSDRLAPERSRVLLSEDRLVVAGGDRRTVVDLEDVVDAFVGRIPQDLGDFFDQSVLVAYEVDGDRQTVMIRGEHDRIDRFARFLYKAILDGTEVRVTSPARRGGRLLDAAPDTASVVTTRDAVTFRTPEGEWRLPLSAVVHVTRASGPRRHGGDPLLGIDHEDGDDVITTAVSHGSVDRLTILGRYLRLEYVRRSRELAGDALGDGQLAALVSLYAGVEPDALPGVLDSEPAAVAESLAELAEGGLLVDADSGDLSTRGRIAVLRRAGRLVE